MASSDSQIDKPQHGRPKRAELPDVNINAGTQIINTERASLTVLKILDCASCFKPCFWKCDQMLFLLFDALMILSCSGWGLNPGSAELQAAGHTAKIVPKRRDCCCGCSQGEDIQPSGHCRVFG